MDVVFRFVCVLLVFHGFVKSLDFEIYKTQKEEEVKSMAAEIVKLDESRCDLVSNCPCSRHACTPIDGSANYDFVCQKTEKSYKYCRAYTPEKQSQCDDVQFNYAMSYFRVAPSASNYAYQIPNEIPMEMCSTICMTSGFEKVLKNPVNRSYGETYFFGSGEGVQRVYPGQEEPHTDEDDLCGLYDPRKRPWYKGAVSIQTQFFILIDNCHRAETAVVSHTPLNAIDVSKQIVQQFIHTLSPNDVVNIITFNESHVANITQTPVSIVDDPSGKNQDISNLSLEIGKITTTQISRPPSVDGFVQAVFTATDIANKFYADYFQVMLLLTNGEFASTALNSSHTQRVSETLTKNSINLFIYCFKKNQNLQSLANQSKGHFELLNSYFDNPLYQISSYFNFMANVRKKVNDTPFWSNYYRDYEGRGRIISVSYQAVSKKGYLIGVVAIDLMIAVFENLPPIGDRPQYHNALANLTVESTDTGCKVTCDVNRAVCAKNSSKTFAELNCCNTCPLSKKHDRKWIVISVAVAAVIAVVITAFAYTILWRMRKRQRGQKLAPNSTFNVSPTSTDLGPYQ